MQFKFMAASLAALSVGGVLAGPIPAPAQDDTSLTARSPDPATDPHLLPRANQAIQATQLTQMQHSAQLWARNHINQKPTQLQLSNAQTWFPQSAWKQNTYHINDWNQYGWSGDVWYLYYLYWYYAQYAWQWNAYWPQRWDGYGYGYCTPGWNC